MIESCKDCRVSEEKATRYEEQYKVREEALASIVNDFGDRIETLNKDIEELKRREADKQILIEERDATILRIQSEMDQLRDESVQLHHIIDLTLSQASQLCKNFEEEYL